MRMWPSFDPLTWLRRHARAVLGPVLPVLAVAWIGAAGPCVAMAAAPGDQSPGRAGQLLADGEPARHEAGAGGAQAADGASRHSHGACPHCPGTSGAASDAHALCATLDDVSDAKRKPFVPVLDAGKAALPLVTVVDPVSGPPSTAALRTDLYRRVFPPAVPLNLRHCVFIV